MIWWLIKGLWEVCKGSYRVFFILFCVMIVLIQGVVYDPKIIDELKDWNGVGHFILTGDV